MELNIQLKNRFISVILEKEIKNNIDIAKVNKICHAEMRKK